MRAGAGRGAPGAPQRAARRAAGDSPYKDTVNLPKTGFSMRANSAQREPELQRFWEANRVYQGLLESNPGVRAHRPRPPRRGRHAAPAPAA